MRSFTLCVYITLATMTGCKIIKDAGTTDDDPDAITVSFTATDVPDDGETITQLYCDSGGKGVTSTYYWGNDIFTVKALADDDSTDDVYFHAEAGTGSHYLDSEAALEACYVNYWIYEDEYWFADSEVEPIDQAEDIYTFTWPPLFSKMQVTIGLVSGSSDDWSGEISLDGAEVSATF